MAICIDCIHGDVCRNAYTLKVEPPNVCGRFKNKADYINIADITKDINFAIQATNVYSEYNVGLRNGLRLALSFIDGKEPEYERCSSKIK